MWIRSQDKESLVDCNDIHVVGNQIRECCRDTKNFITLGRYSWTERAVEVLDEIQKFMQEKEVIKYYDTSTLNYSDGVNIKDHTVYEMPKE